ALGHPAGSCGRDGIVIVSKADTLPARGQRPGGVCCRTKDRNSYSACCSEILLSFTALVRPDCKKKKVIRHQSETLPRMILPETLDSNRSTLAVLLS
ncbi:hypothetical protein N340_06423, partial [Tauraco erythrolophus]